MAVGKQRAQPEFQPAFIPNTLLPGFPRELLRDFSYNGIRTLITLAIAICLATLYANQGQEVGTWGGELACNNDLEAT